MMFDQTSLYCRNRLLLITYLDTFILPLVNEHFTIFLLSRSGTSMESHMRSVSRRVGSSLDNQMVDRSFVPPEESPSLAGLPQSDIRMLSNTPIEAQVKQLSRRVAALERDSQSRANRELFFMSLGVIYVLLKGVMWLNRNW